MTEDAFFCPINEFVLNFKQLLGPLRKPCSASGSFHHFTGCQELVTCLTIKWSVSTCDIQDRFLGPRKSYRGGRKEA